MIIITPIVPEISKNTKQFSWLPKFVITPQHADLEVDSACKSLCAVGRDNQWWDAEI